MGCKNINLSLIIIIEIIVSFLKFLENHSIVIIHNVLWLCWIIYQCWICLKFLRLLNSPWTSIWLTPTRIFIFFLKLIDMISVNLIDWFLFYNLIFFLFRNLNCFTKSFFFMFTFFSFFNIFPTSLTQICFWWTNIKMLDIFTFLNYFIAQITFLRFKFTIW